MSNKMVYLGNKQRICLRTLNGEFYSPTSTTTDQIIARNFALRADGGHGMVMMLANRYTNKSGQNETRYQDAKPFSDYSHEKECLFYGYRNTIIVIQVKAISTISFLLPWVYPICMKLNRLY